MKANHPTSEEAQTKVEVQTEAVRVKSDRELERNQMSDGFIRDIFSNTKCPPEIKIEVMRLEKLMWEMCRVLYFEDPTSEVIKEAILQVRDTFKTIVVEKTRQHNERKNR